MRQDLQPTEQTSCIIPHEEISAARDDGTLRMHSAPLVSTGTRSSSLRAQRSNPESFRGDGLDCFAALAMTEHVALARTPNHRCHAPRRRGIQYAAADVVKANSLTQASGILDRPPSRAMTRNMRRRRTISSSRLVSPELCLSLHPLIKRAQGRPGAGWHPRSAARIGYAQKNRTAAYR